MTTREHWYAEATQLAQLDCVLLNLLPEHDRNLSKLPNDLQSLVRTKLDELIGGCCHAQELGAEPAQLLEQLAKDIWNFLKPWKASTNVPRGTIETTGAT